MHHITLQKSEKFQDIQDNLGFLTPSCIFSNRMVPLKADPDMEAVAFLMYAREMEDEAGHETSKSSSTLNAVLKIEDRTPAMDEDDILEVDSKV